MASTVDPQFSKPVSGSVTPSWFRSIGVLLVLALLSSCVPRISQAQYRKLSSRNAAAILQRLPTDGDKSPFVRFPPPPPPPPHDEDNRNVGETAAAFGDSSAVGAEEAAEAMLDWTAADPRAGTSSFLPGILRRLKKNREGKSNSGSSSQEHEHEHDPKRGGNRKFQTQGWRR